MILWNVCSKFIESRYDGRIFEFAPDERKTIHEPDVYNHLYYKLKRYGLVLLPEGSTEEAEKKILIDGLRARWKTRDSVVRGFKTMNKDREKNTMAAETPSEAVMDAAEEAAEILARLKEIEGDRVKKVDEYINDDRTRKAAAAIDSNEQVIEEKGSFETRIGAKGAGKSKTNAASARNP